MHIPRRFTLREFWPLHDLINTHSRLEFPDHILWLENDAHEVLGVILLDKIICAVGGREDIVLELDAISIGITIVHGNCWAVIYGPVRLHAHDLQTLIIRQQLAQMTVRKRDVNGVWRSEK